MTAVVKLLLKSVYDNLTTVTAIWKPGLINTLLGRKRKLNNVKQLIIDDTIISDDKLIVESFNEYFINVGINIGAESEQIYEIPTDDQIPESELSHSPNIRFKFANINVTNVAMNLSNLRASKATGMDNLPAKTSQNLIILNCAITYCHF